MYEFHDTDDAVSHLLKKKVEIEKWFDHRLETLDEATRYTWAGDTFRAFRKMPQSPSAVVRSWASTELQNQNVGMVQEPGKLD